MKMKYVVFLLLGSMLCGAVQAQEVHYDGAVQQINLINWTHTDYGYTEHPLLVAELQKRYIDIALDAAETTRKNRSGERFTWTVEALDPLLQWWRETTPERRKMMQRAIARGQIDLNIMPFTIHQGLDGNEMDCLMNWLPPEVADKIRPTIAIQNDVNGFPRAAVSRALDRGVRYVWMGMNGRHPFPVPTLSWWQMPDGRKALLWNGVSYWAGYDFFHATRWRTMQREAANLQYRWPRENEFFCADEASVRKAHIVCCGKLRELERKGFKLAMLPVTFSNQWRCDNDGPYPLVVAFVQKWNELGLKPILHLTTATASMQQLEKIAGMQAQTLHGEFGDWWAFGLSAMPRETAVARNARYQLKAALSPIFSPLTTNQTLRKEEIERDLCTYYEHTFASYDSGENSYDTHNQGTMNEAFRYAYKAYEYARWLLAQRARVKVNAEAEGVVVINTQPTDFSGWCMVEKASLREHRNARSLRDAVTGVRTKLYLHGGNYYFWTENLPGECVRRFIPDSADAVETAICAEPEIQTDSTGWPIRIRWEGMAEPLFDGEAPRLYVSRFVSGGWWGATAVPGDCRSVAAETTRRQDTPQSIVFTQELTNERLVSARRIMTVYKHRERVHVTLEFDRKLHPKRQPEVIYAEFPFPDLPRKVTTTNGGMEFEPYHDHIPNTCKTFFLADSWVKFATSDGARVWASVTSPIFELGKHLFFRGGDVQEPANSNLLQSMIYNNGWGVNFPVEYTGKTSCEYDIYWQSGNPDRKEVDAVTDTYLVRPVVVNNPQMAENALYDKWLNDASVKN